MPMHRTPRPAPMPAAVRRLMRQYGISEPSARALAPLAFGERRQNGS